MAQLPAIPEAGKLDHMWFELTGGHATAVGILVRRLGVGGAARAALGLARRQLLTDPFADLPAPAPDDLSAWLTRRQLLPVLLLDEALQEDLGLPADEARDVLGELIADVGAELLRSRFPPLEVEAWKAATPAERERLVRRVFARTGNIARAEVDSGEDWVSLDVRACSFVQLCGAVGKPELARLFCVADSRFFGQPEAPVTLERSTTLANGGPCCDFRFSLKDG